MTPERKKLVLILVLVAVVDLLIAAGGFFLWLRWYHRPHELPDEKEQAQLAVRLLNLSAAAEGYFSSLPTAPSDNETEMLRKVTEHDPRLLNQLDKHRLRIKYSQKHALLLLCTADGKQALLEDIGCTTRLDRQVREAAPCEFTLKVEAACQ